MGRVFWTRANQYIIRINILDLFKGDFVASVHLYMKIIVHKHLYQIVRKRIVVIDDKQLGHDSHPQIKKATPLSLGGLLPIT